VIKFGRGKFIYNLKMNSMKKLSIVLSLMLVMGMLFSACSLLQYEEVVTVPVEDAGENGSEIDMSIEILPEGEEEEATNGAEIPMAVEIE
jgi:hypothetical protein